MIEFDIKEVLANGNDIVSLAKAGELQGAISILKIVRKMLDAEETELDERPRINCEDIRKDIRFRLGVRWTLKNILALPQEAQEIVRSAGT